MLQRWGAVYKLRLSKNETFGHFSLWLNVSTKSNFLIESDHPPICWTSLIDIPYAVYAMRSYVESMTEHNTYYIHAEMKLITEIDGNIFL